MPGAGNGAIAAVLDALAQEAEELRRVEADVRRRAETLDVEVESERRRYRELFELAPDAYVVTDAKGNIVEANNAFERMAGLSGGFVPGKPLAAYVHADDRRAFRSLLLELARGGRATEYEFRLRRRGAPPVPASATAAAEPSRDGASVDIRWLVRDMTERKRAETHLRALNAVLEDRVAQRTAELATANEKLESERNRLNRVLERLDEAIIAVNRDLRVEFANGAARKLLRPASVAPGAPLPDAWPEKSLRALAAPLFEHGAKATDDRVTSGERTYSVFGTPARASDTAVLVIGDVSERERRERAERDFVTNAAHELQTPLTAIASATEILQSGAKEDPEERDRFLTHIEEATERLVRLTRALLVLARAQTGEERPRAECVELDALLRDIAAGLHHHEGVEVRIVSDGGVGATLNRELAEQAVANLAANAAKFTLSGEVTLAARIVDDDWVAVEVRDSGPGIPADRLERVFDRFYRGENASASGFGIGLAIVWQAVRALGGDVKIDSGPDEGTTARILLPRAPVAS